MIHNRSNTYDYGLAPLSDLPESDEELVELLMRGSTSALEALFVRYSDAVYFAALRWLSNEEAERVVEDIFLGLRHAVRWYDPAKPFDRWLDALVHRTAALRRNALQARDELELERDEL